MQARKVFFLLTIPYYTSAHGLCFFIFKHTYLYSYDHNGISGIILYELFMISKNCNKRLYVEIYSRVSRPPLFLRPPVPELLPPLYCKMPHLALHSSFASSCLVLAPFSSSFLLFLLTLLHFLPSSLLLTVGIGFKGGTALAARDG